ncbi:MAG TPA: serine/threonine protein kinase [Burkholderiales bacterium]|nr:serine/threonine protein kinase [Burkholderiales bacterium]
MADPHPYSALTPDCVLDAVESRGLRCDGRFIALNSYENRVFQVLLEEDRGGAVIVKFYRPGRWSDAQILEERAFALELAEREIPVVAPLAGDDGATLSVHAGFRFALFPRQPGRAPELDRADTLEWLGRFLGRIHAVGAVRRFRERPALTPETFGRAPLQLLLDGNWLPADLRASYETIARQLLDAIERRYAEAGQIGTLRLHGDCHAGNILWTDKGPHFVDLDDCRSGPAVQDLWMLLSGSREEMAQQLGKVLSGYREFHDFDTRELLLIEPLRALRMIHYSAWLASRWDDPAFPAAFPWFNTQRYWQEQVLQLREQLAALDESPLEAG